MSREFNNTFDEVKAFIEHRWRNPFHKITLETRLEKDLGITGDDAIEFMEAFSNKFDLDFSLFNFLKFFNEEGLMLNLRRMFSAEKRIEKADKPLIVKDLVMSVVRKEWVSTGSESI